MKKTILLIMTAILAFTMALTGCSDKKTEDEKLEDSLQDRLEDLESQYGAESKSESDDTAASEAEPENYDVDFFADAESHIHYNGEEGSARAYVAFSGDYSFQVGDYTLKHSNLMYGNCLSVIYQNKDLGDITFLCDPGEAILKEGDKLTVKINFDQAIRNHFTEKNLTYRSNQTYTVPSIGKYITSASQLTAENIEELKTSAYEAISTGAFESKTFDSIYFGTAKQGADTKGVQYIVVALYSCIGNSITKPKPVSFPYVAAENVIGNNGTLKYEFQRHAASVLNKSAAETLESLSENYTFEKIG